MSAANRKIWFFYIIGRYIYVFSIFSKYVYLNTIYQNTKIFNEVKFLLKIIYSWADVIIK